MWAAIWVAKADLKWSTVDCSLRVFGDGFQTVTVLVKKLYL